MKQGTAKLKFKGINMQIFYEYTRFYPGTYETPPEEAEFYIYAVEVEGINIIELLGDGILVEIEEEFVKQNKI